MTDQPLEPAVPQAPEPSTAAPATPEEEPEPEGAVSAEPGSVTAEPAAATAEPARGPERRRGSVVLGLVFVALGVVFLLDEVWPDLVAWKYVWPIALIAVGLAILLRARR